MNLRPWSRAHLVALAASMLAPLLLAPGAHGAWNPNGNLLSLGTAAENGYSDPVAQLALVPDGAGGAFAAWTDRWVVRVQRVTAHGEIPAGWPSQGIEVTATSPAFSYRGGELYPAAVADGAGGVIVAWWANRSQRPSGVYAQRITAGGARVWSDSGVTVSEDHVGGFALAADGTGGAILAWERSVGSFELYGSRLHGTGTIATGWPIRIAPLAVHQISPSVVADGAGGAIIVWADRREAPAWAIYGLRVLANGATAPGWPADGALLCLAPDTRYYPSTIPDGFGGAVVTWADLRAGNHDLFAQHVDASGSLPPGWTTSAVAVAQGPGDQGTPASGPDFQDLTTDGAGGALLAWMDTRGGGYDLYASHLTASGAVAAGWMANGNPICTAPLQQWYPVLAADGAGGALLAWSDRRSGSDDIYLTRFDGSGGRSGSWPVNGKPICTASNDQRPLAICSDGVDGAIVAWRDFRRGDLLRPDVYALRVQGDGSLPTASVIRDFPAELAIGFIRPNPASGPVSIGVRLAGETPARLEWLDVHGRRVLDRPLAGSGAHTVRVDPGPLPAGLYFVQLVQGDRRVMARVARTR